MVGQFKDDRFQSHKHIVNLQYPNGGGSGTTTAWAFSQAYNSSGYWQNSADRFVSTTERNGSTTRGKSKGVKFIIKVL